MKSVLLFLTSTDNTMSLVKHFGLTPYSIVCFIVTIPGYIHLIYSRMEKYIYVMSRINTNVGIYLQNCCLRQ